VRNFMVDSGRWLLGREPCMHAINVPCEIRQITRQPGHLRTGEVRRHGLPCH
jgi:hypothetical protein